MNNFAKEVHIPHVRMRTQSQALNDVKAMDPSSALTAHGLRTLLLQNKIKYIRMGVKYLVNFDSLLEYLANPDDQMQNEEPKVEYGKLRKIQEG